MGKNPKKNNDLAQLLLDFKMHHELTVIKTVYSGEKKSCNRIGGDHKQTEIHVDIQFVIKVAFQFSEEREMIQ